MSDLDIIALAQSCHIVKLRLCNYICRRTHISDDKPSCSASRDRYLQHPDFIGRCGIREGSFCRHTHAASPWLIREEPLPKETHRPGASRRRGETPHLLGSSLIAICDRASKGKYHDETPTVHKTTSLPLRPMLRELQPPVPDSG